MVITQISTDQAPVPGSHYSQGVVAGNILWTAGQVGVNRADGTVPADFPSQMRQALSNLKAVVEASGAILTSVVKTTCFLTDTGDFEEFDTIYSEFFGEHRPARSTFAVALARGFLFEIEAVAIVGGKELGTVASGN